MPNLIGTAPNQVPVNGMLGTAAFMDAAQLPVSAPQTATLVTKANPVLLPAASATPANNGELVFEHTSNTSLTLRLKGTDGVVRSVALTLA